MIRAAQYERETWHAVLEWQQGIGYEMQNASKLCLHLFDASNVKNID